MVSKRGPMVLCILDGWGHREEAACNAITTANTPVWDKIWETYPHTLITTHGAAIGLPAEQMGNSEVGHLTIGGGRVVYQEYTRICLAIRTESFFDNQTLVDPIDAAIEADKAVHIAGLLSPGGVHSHEEHLHAMVQMAVQRGAKKVYVHAFLDGRDTPPKSARKSLEKMEAVCKEHGGGQIATISGRYFGMDRDHRWPRVEKAYDAMVCGEGEFHATSSIQGLEMAYERGETDEFVSATTIAPEGEEPTQMEDGDVVLLMNYRSDRARQISKALSQEDFYGFKRKRWPALHSVTALTEYKKEYGLPVAFPPEYLNNVLGEYISRFGLRQLRIAETEKYAHVTFFFNGKREEPFPFEDRILISSPDVKTYDLKPEMSAPAVTSRLVEEIRGGKYDVIICNFANSDMVGHSGKMDAAVKAIETLDHCLEHVLDAVQQVNGDILITADHGNSEMMCEADGSPHTAHTLCEVPFVYAGNSVNVKGLIEGGTLADIAPTMLHIMGLEKPEEMTGESLIEEE